MRRVLVLLFFAGCAAQPPALPPEVPAGLPAHCTTATRLPKPPHDDRSIAELITWARSAAKAANSAIAERDACALDYLNLRAACATERGCIIPYKGKSP